MRVARRRVVAAKDLALPLARRLPRLPLLLQSNCRFRQEFPPCF